MSMHTFTFGEALRRRALHLMDRGLSIVEELELSPWQSGQKCLGLQKVRIRRNHTIHVNVKNMICLLYTSDAADE